MAARRRTLNESPVAHATNQRCTVSQPIVAARVFVVGARGFADLPSCLALLHVRARSPVTLDVVCAPIGTPT